MIATKDICWLAGLLEGEGCFGFYNSITISLYMTDGDVVQRAGNIMDARVKGPIDRGPGRKPHWRMLATGQKAAEWSMTLYPLLGLRKRARIADAMTQWRATRVYRKPLRTRAEVVR